MSVRSLLWQHELSWETDAFSYAGSRGRMPSIAPVAVENPRLEARVWARATLISNSIAGVTDFRLI